MKRVTSAMVLLLGLTLTARGHFVFLVPGEGERKATVIFSDNLKPDREELLKKIAHTKYMAIVEGKSTRLESVECKGSVYVEVPGKAATWLIGVCPYGVIARGKEPFLLTYYARAVVGTRAGDAIPATAAKEMKLDIVPALEGKSGPEAKVTWDGKPLAGAEVALYVPGKDEPVTAKTDANGIVKLTPATKSGQYAIRVGHIEATKGKHDGKEYAAKRSYATCVFPVAAAK